MNPITNTKILISLTRAIGISKMMIASAEAYRRRNDTENIK